LRVLDLTRRDPHPAARKIYAIQLFRPGTQRSIATPPDVSDNFGGNFLGLDVLTFTRREQPLFHRAG
jgi:hypothetical protein